MSEYAQKEPAKLVLNADGPVKPKTGTPDDIPNTMGPQCRKLLAEDVRKRLDYEDINHINPEPGTCRFCGVTLPIAHSHIEAFGTMPVFQCDTAANLWDRAEALRIRRLEEYAARTKAAAQSGKSTVKPREYF